MPRRELSFEEQVDCWLEFVRVWKTKDASKISAFSFSQQTKGFLVGTACHNFRKGYLHREKNPLDLPAEDIWALCLGYMGTPERRKGMERVFGRYIDRYLLNCKDGLRQQGTLFSPGDVCRKLMGSFTELNYRFGDFYAQDIHGDKLTRNHTVRDQQESADGGTYSLSDRQSAIDYAYTSLERDTGLNEVVKAFVQELVGSYGLRECFLVCAIANHMSLDNEVVYTELNIGRKTAVYNYRTRFRQEMKNSIMEFIQSNHEQDISSYLVWGVTKELNKQALAKIETEYADSPLFTLVQQKIDIPAMPNLEQTETDQV